MALSGVSADIPDSEYIDFKSLASEGAAVVVSIRELCAPEEQTHGQVEPVRARVIVLSGSQKGEVFEDEKIINKGVTNSLRRRNVGDDVVGRIRPYGSGKWPGLEREDAGDIELAEKALAHFGPLDAQQIDEPAAPVKRKTSAKATADDDEPPF
jgi:hypothetical protein